MGVVPEVWRFGADRADTFRSSRCDRNATKGNGFLARDRSDTPHDALGRGVRPRARRRRGCHLHPRARPGRPRLVRDGARGPGPRRRAPARRGRAVGQPVQRDRGRRPESAVQPDSERRRHRRHRPHRRSRRRRAHGAHHRLLLAVRGPSPGTRRDRLRLRERDRRPQSRHRSPHAQLRHAAGRRRFGDRRVLPAVLAPGDVSRPRHDGRDAREPRDEPDHR